ncbi:bifunctional NUDIX hydrolase/histidine phosphatase family protein [Nocardia sp. NPDC024068]|uniref:NUDIX hydrolase n=1 Tax=Nocardia sp. NPDC024068 TaxID=3157197 RepID=UPI003404CD36
MNRGHTPPSYPDPRTGPNIYAAGTVLWRHSLLSSGGIDIAVIRRPKYQDWSLPKGKLDPGETPVLAAARETEEETGLRPRLGRYLGKVTYPITGHRKMKRVDYWAAEVLSGEFTANNEVDALTWCPLDTVMSALSYPMDRQIVRAFTRLPPDTRTALVVRHAKAGRRDRFKGPDEQRPLELAGYQQALALVPNLQAFGVGEVFSAEPLRCVQTVTPLAEDLGVKVAVEPLLGDIGYAGDTEKARERIRSLALTARNVPVFCSQGDAIPDLVRWWAERDGMRLSPARTRKGSVWVLSFAGERLVAADHLDRSLSVDTAPAVAL